ncbi:amidase [Rhodococcus sp. NPDC058505]|uniref:amidase n=1 Tax=unclassified Rhodococcus (in: high G+C Gram-positive bacteria) TaxID=192944 RepID=UPI00366A4268
MTVSTGAVHAFRDDALGDLDATGVAARIAAGEISSREAVDAAIARAEAVTALAAVETPDFDRARHRSDSPGTGPFAGVPTFVKDNVDVAGLPTGEGSAAYTARPAAADGPSVTQLLSTGLVALGKSRLPEFGFSPTTEFAGAEPTHNPWNPAYSSGASSGGAAALVASGVVPIAHGNDGGGSIRIPAAACGLVGLKPSRGRMCADPQDRSMPIRIVTQGVVTRTVRDTARYYAAAESHYRNPKLPPIRLVEGPSSTRLRVGVVTDSVNGTPTDDETRAAVTATADLLAELGHHVTQAPLPVGPEFVEDFSIYWGFLSFALCAGGKRMLGPDFDRSRTDNLTRGLDALYRRSIAKTPRVLYRLQRTAQRAEHLFSTYDVVLSPVLGHTTPELGYLSPTQPFDELFEKIIRYTAFTPLNNAAGTPAISLPLHTTSTGLPLGVHLSAAHGDERTLLELAFELEQARPWRRIQD